MGRRSRPRRVRRRRSCDRGRRGDQGRARRVRSAEHPPKDALVLRGCAELGEEVDETRRNGVGCGDCGRCGVRLPPGREAVGARGCTSPRRGAAGRGSSRTPPVTGSWSRRARGGRRGATTVGGRRGGSSACAHGRRWPRARCGRRGPARTRHRSPGDRPLPAAAPGGGHRGVPRRGRDDVARDDAGGAIARHLDLDGDGTGDGRNDALAAVVESAPGTPGLIALVFPGKAARVRRGDAPDPARRPDASRIARERARGRVHVIARGPAPDRLRARGPRRARRGAREGPGSPWEGGRADGRGRRAAALVHAAGGWTRRGGRPFDACRRAFAGPSFAPNRATVVSAHQMGSARAGAATRTTRATRGAGCGGPTQALAATESSAGCTSATPRCSRRARRQPDDHDDGLGAARRADGARRG